MAHLTGLPFPPLEQESPLGVSELVQMGTLGDIQDGADDGIYSLATGADETYGRLSTLGCPSPKKTVNIADDIRPAHKC
jgi:hypothetical protein